MVRYNHLLAGIAATDAAKVQARDETYGQSWCRRGGQGAYFATIRKVDRIEEAAKKYGYDIFRAVVETKSGDEGADDGLITDIRDLRRYLLLWEAYLTAVGDLPAPPGGKPLYMCDSLGCIKTPGHPGDHSDGRLGWADIATVELPDFCGVRLQDNDNIISFNLVEDTTPYTMDAWCMRAKGHGAVHQYVHPTNSSEVVWTTFSTMDRCVLLDRHDGRHLWESQAHPVEERPREPRCQAARQLP